MPAREPEALEARGDLESPRTVVRPDPATTIRSAPWFAPIVVAVLATVGAFWIAGAGAFLEATDHVSDTERAARTRAFDAATPITAVALPGLVALSEAQQMGLQGKEFHDLRRDLERGAGTEVSAAGAIEPAARAHAVASAPVAYRPPIRVVRLTLWDTHANDGDVVQIHSAGYVRDIVIAHTPTMIAIPMREGGGVRILGIRDGGGGITIGAAHENIQLPLPLMSEGQELVLPLRLR